MLTYTLTFENELAAMRRYGITPDELYIARLILMCKDSSIGVNYMNQYLETSEDARKIVRPVLKNLQEKGIILKSFDPEQEKIVPADIPFNKNATKFFYRAAFDMGKELFDVYPKYAMIDGNCVSISGVSKRFNSQEDAFNFYGREIRWNPETHNHMVEITKWAAENTRMINCVFSSYIIDHRWEFIESMRNGEQGNVNFDTIRML